MKQMIKREIEAYNRNLLRRWTAWEDGRVRKGKGKLMRWKETDERWDKKYFSFVVNENILCKEANNAGMIRE